jgi:hypothetical protein
VDVFMDVNVDVNVDVDVHVVVDADVVAVVCLNAHTRMITGSLCNREHG